MIAQWTTDLRHSLRAQLRTPAVHAMCVGTLALAIDAMAGMVSVVNTVLFRALPFTEPECLVALAGTSPGPDLPERHA